ncbi:MAG TPA: aminopeptidase P family protein [Firmicutes bacterium]|jgi:Xaa-Pro dipeptidase|nr:aminopeptidase P family protein [Bacillota bacterium]HOQ24296.1 Xaa-Pro peptidase family protein [Bacillota bacterium]HPT67457.1 Xaa-Pro peptidase family protein [Bacillota bacterium]
MESALFAQRRGSLQEELSRRGIAAALLSDRVDRFYFSGTMQSSYLIIPAEKEAFLLTGRAGEGIAREVPGLKVYTFQNPAELSACLAEAGLVGRLRLGINPETMTAVEFGRWQRWLPAAVWEDIAPLLKRRRRIKDEVELAALRKAGEALRELPKWAAAALKEGKTSELALSVALESKLRLKGHGGFVRCGGILRESAIGVATAGASQSAGRFFAGVGTGGELDPVVSYGPGKHRIEPGDPVLLGYIMNYRGYHCKQTRMISYGKNPPAAARQVYDDLLEIVGLLEQELKPGAVAAELYALVAKAMERKNRSESLPGLGGKKGKFFGHGIGLLLDEEPYLVPGAQEKLQAGMAIAVELAVMLRGIGVVGIGDTYLITKEGQERITPAQREWRTVVTDPKTLKASG